MQDSTTTVYGCPAAAAGCCIRMRSRKRCFKLTENSIGDFVLAHPQRPQRSGVGYSYFTALGGKLKLIRPAHMVLLTAAPETPLGGEVITSQIAQFCVMGVLSVAVAVAIREG